MELIIGGKIPEGLAAVVEGLTREILRHQPENIYAFAAHHFDELRKLREKERRVISSEKCPSEKVVGLLEEIVRRETRKMTVPRRRREASNRNGWSIRETVKACKRYEKEKVAGGGESRRIGKGNERDRGSGGFLRSSSTGDIVSKNRRLVESREKFDSCPKRRMSADRIEKALWFGRKSGGGGRETKKSAEANLNGTLVGLEKENRKWREEAAKDEEDSTGEGERIVEGVFPSVVVARPVASSRDELCEFANEQKNLVLPPIAADSFKPIPPKKGKNVMLLPSLSASEIEGREYYSSVANEKDTSVPNSGRKGGEEEEEEEEVGAAGLVEGKNSAQGEEKEILADSSNVTPDSMEVDSLEEHASATRERKEEESCCNENETKRTSSELKSKLIEIENVEKSIIERALASDRSSLFVEREEEEGEGKDLVVARNDESSKSYVLTEGSSHEIPESVTTERIFPNDRETNSEGEAKVELGDRYSFHGALDPFGEYVCCNPESVRYTTSIDAADLLRGIKNTLDYATVRPDLANISEVETVETASVKREFFMENSSGKIGKNESETELGSDCSDVRVNSESSANRSDTLEGEKEGEDGCCEPYVPELNFDSLRDATISSSKRSKSDSTNVDTHSERESEDIAAVPESNVRATDTRPVENNHELDIEEEIARELIRNLALETLETTTQQCSKRKISIENSPALIYADQSTSSPDQRISSARNTRVKDVVEKIDGLEEADGEFEGGEETAVEETKRVVEAAGTIELWARRKVSKKEAPVEIASPLLKDMSERCEEDAGRASTAATTIQANYRGYRVRKQLKEMTAAASTTNRKEEEGSIPKGEDATRESLEERSATKIQARVRGFLVRKKQQAARVAATKIQAGFRGFQTRKLLKQSER